MQQPRHRNFLPARLPGLLDRNDFLTLVELDVEAFNSLRRRDQLPLTQPHELPKIGRTRVGGRPLRPLH